MELQPDELDFNIHMRKRLADKGWLTMAWPAEYGGGGASIARQMVFNEEIFWVHGLGRL